MISLCCSSGSVAALLYHLGKAQLLFCIVGKVNRYVGGFQRLHEVLGNQRTSLIIQFQSKIMNVGFDRFVGTLLFWFPKTLDVGKSNRTQSKSPFSSHGDPAPTSRPYHSYPTPIPFKFVAHRNTLRRLPMPLPPLSPAPPKLIPRPLTSMKPHRTRTSSLRLSSTLVCVPCCRTCSGN